MPPHVIVAFVILGVMLLIIGGPSPAVSASEREPLDRWIRVVLVDGRNPCTVRDVLNGC